MKKIVVEKNDAGQRLDKFMHKFFKSAMPTSMIYKSIRKKRIKINGKRGNEGDILQVGDVLEMYINDEFFETEKTPVTKVKADFDVVYEDENIILIDKRAGIVVHDDDNGTVNTLVNQLYSYLIDKGEYNPDNENSFVPSLCNRIDRNTSGIVICAKTATALRVLNQKMKDRELHKLYLCVVHGKMEKKTDTLEGYLVKDEKKNKVFISETNKNGGKFIRTKYTVLGYSDGLSLLEIDLLTGRTHQIRAHMAYLGMPVLGDSKYGDNNLNRQLKLKYQLLCSCYLKLGYIEDERYSYLSFKEFSCPDPWFVESFKNRKL